MAYEHLTPYKRPSDYIGATWNGWYAVVGQSRDSSALERSNYRRVFEDLRKLDTELAAEFETEDHSAGDSTVCDTRCSHWAVGWVETVYVHSSNTAACELADKILGELADYPVYDEQDFSELEDEDCRVTWEKCFDEHERAKYLRKHCRRFDSGEFRTIRAAVKGNWYDAANLLPCPSDLIA